jgi:hypothetical protein
LVIGNESGSQLLHIRRNELFWYGSRPAGMRLPDVFDIAFRSDMSRCGPLRRAAVENLPEYMRRASLEVAHFKPRRGKSI